MFCRNFIAHFFQQFKHTITPAINPQVYITSVSHIRVRIQPSICRSLEHRRFPPLSHKQLCKPGSFGIQQLIMPLDCLHFTSPLEHQHFRRLFTARQTTNSTIDDSRNLLFKAFRMQILPLSRIKLLRRHSKSDSQKFKKIIFFSVIHCCES